MNIGPCVHIYSVQRVKFCSLWNIGCNCFAPPLLPVVMQSANATTWITGYMPKYTIEKCALFHKVRNRNFRLVCANVFGAAQLQWKCIRIQDLHAGRPRKMIVIITARLDASNGRRALNCYICNESWAFFLFWQNLCIINSLSRCRRGNLLLLVFPNCWCNIFQIHSTAFSEATIFLQIKFVHCSKLNRSKRRGCVIYFGFSIEKLSLQNFYRSYFTFTEAKIFAKELLPVSK